jgi:CheY-like chemotaxis protein
VFHVYFPAAASDVKSAPVIQPATQRQHAEHVLYVDDEEALVSLTTRLLKRLGYTVTGHTDPQAALREFRSRPQSFDVVVTDLAMPRMSGFELARELRATRPDVLIVLTSGYLRKEDQETAQAMDIRDLILKPNTVEELGRTLDRIFQTQGNSHGTPQ